MILNRPCSYSRYRTGTSLQVRLMRGMIFPRMSLHSMLQSNTGNTNMAYYDSFFVLCLSKYGTLHYILVQIFKLFSSVLQISCLRGKLVLFFLCHSLPTKLQNKNLKFLILPHDFFVYLHNFELGLISCAIDRQCKAEFRNLKLFPYLTDLMLTKFCSYFVWKASHLKNC